MCGVGSQDNFTITTLVAWAPLEKLLILITNDIQIELLFNY